MKVCLMCRESLIEEISFRKIICFTKLEKENLCRTCRQKFNSLSTYVVCQGCGRIWSEGNYCFDCLNWKKVDSTLILNHQSLYEYNDWMKEWIEGFKFKGDYQLGNVFSEELKKFMAVKKREDFLIVPIPISQNSYAVRGFNQVEVLLDFAQVKYESILINESLEIKQSSKNRQERLLTKQPFKVKKNSQEKLKGQAVLLVDDIYTTGRTILYAKKLIKNSGASLVQSVSLAR